MAFKPEKHTSGMGAMFGIFAGILISLYWNDIIVAIIFGVLGAVAGDCAERKVRCQE